MDPISLIIGALVVGATASMQTTASDAVKDSYAGLKALIQRRFAGNPRAEYALLGHEEDPETYEQPLKKALIQEQIDQDEDIIAGAQRLLTLVQPQQALLKKNNIKLYHAQGVIIGDYAKQTNNFGNQSKKDTL